MMFSYEDNSIWQRFTLKACPYQVTSPPHSNLLPLEHEDHSVLSAIYPFRDPIDFFVCLHSTVGG